MIITEPGIYENISNEDYHTSEGISNSGIGLLLPPNCPKLYHYKYLSGLYEKKESPEFAIGTAVHTMVLEPDTFFDRFSVIPKVDRRTSAGKESYSEFVKLSAGKTIIDQDIYDQICEMSLALTEHNIFKKIINSECGHIEESIAWQDDESGVLLRTRPDFYNDNLILDVKTTKDVRLKSFVRSIADYGYHRQAAMACDGLTSATGRQYDTVVLFVVSKEAPYLVKSYVLNSDAIERGRAEYKAGAKIYQQCKAAGEWPGYDEVIENVELPGWAFSEGIE